MIKKALILPLFSALLISATPIMAHSDNLPPLTGAKTAKMFNDFRTQAGKDFLLPQVFKNHPGVTFMLSHAKELGLTEKQIKRLKVIRRKMLARSLAQFKKINAQRAAYLAMAEKSQVDSRKLHKDLHNIAWLMAQATADHLTGHLNAAKVLTADQRKKLSSLK
ncbi:MAG: hypothetical protein ACP5OS_09470 [Leptospirillia bacterium]